MKKGKVVIMGSRGNGKSTDLLRLALQDHADIACLYRPEHYIDIAVEQLHIPREEISIDRERREVKIRDVRIAPINHCIRKAGEHEENKPLYVDELECAINYLLNREINGYTLSVCEYFAEV